MRIFKSIVLGINQLLIHLLCLVCIEAIMFYTIIKVQSVNKLESFISQINVNNVLGRLVDFIVKFILPFPVGDVGAVRINMKNTKNYVDDFITVNNEYVFFIILTIIIVILLLLTISYIMTGMFEYNLITTVASLVISIPIQMIYLFEFNIKGNPLLEFFMSKKIKEVMIEYVDSL